MRTHLECTLHLLSRSMKTFHKQECIPVGCVPADRRPYAGVCFPGGFSIPGGSAPGGCLVWGVCLVRGGCACSWGGGVWSGGVLHARGVVGVVASGPGGSGKENPPGWENPFPPVNRMTDRCKNITLAKTSFRPVNTRGNIINTSRDHEEYEHISNSRWNDNIKSNCVITKRELATYENLRTETREIPDTTEIVYTKLDHDSAKRFSKAWSFFM